VWQMCSCNVKMHVSSETHIKMFRTWKCVTRVLVSCYFVYLITSTQTSVSKVIIPLCRSVAVSTLKGHRRVPELGTTSYPCSGTRVCASEDMKGATSDNKVLTHSGARRNKSTAFNKSRYVL